MGEDKFSQHEPIESNAITTIIRIKVANWILKKEWGLIKYLEKRENVGDIIVCTNTSTLLNQPHRMDKSCYRCGSTVP